MIKVSRNSSDPHQRYNKAIRLNKTEIKDIKMPFRSMPFNDNSIDYLIPPIICNFNALQTPNISFKSKEKLNYQKTKVQNIFMIANSLPSDIKNEIKKQNKLPDTINKIVKLNFKENRKEHFKKLGIEEKNYEPESTYLIKYMKNQHNKMGRYQDKYKNSTEYKSNTDQEPKVLVDQIFDEKEMKSLKNDDPERNFSLSHDISLKSDISKCSDGYKPRVGRDAKKRMKNDLKVQSHSSQIYISQAYDDSRRMSNNNTEDFRYDHFNEAQDKSKLNLLNSAEFSEGTNARKSKFKPVSERNDKNLSNEKKDSNSDSEKKSYFSEKNSRKSPRKDSAVSVLSPESSKDSKNQEKWFKEKPVPIEKTENNSKDLFIDLKDEPIYGAEQTGNNFNYENLNTYQEKDYSQKNVNVSNRSFYFIDEVQKKFPRIPKAISKAQKEKKMMEKLLDGDPLEFYNYKKANNLRIQTWRKKHKTILTDTEIKAKNQDLNNMVHKNMRIAGKSHSKSSSPESNLLNAKDSYLNKRRLRNLLRRRKNDLEMELYFSKTPLKTKKKSNDYNTLLKTQERYNSFDYNDKSFKNKTTESNYSGS